MRNESINRLREAPNNNTLTDITCASGIEEFYVFFQDRFHEVEAQVASDAFTQDIEDCRAHPYAKS